MRRQIMVALVVTLAVLAGSAGAARIAAARASTDFSGTLTVFDWGSLGLGPAGKGVVAAYEKMHPHVKVQFIAQPADPSVYIKQVLAAGTAPDVMMPSFTPETFEDIPQGYWLDLTPYMQRPDPYVPGNKHWSDLVNPVDYQENAYLGKKFYVFTWSTQDAAFYYNKDAFAKAGITHTPATWAEFIADQAALQKAGYIPAFYALGEPYPIAENGTFISVLENQTMSASFKKMDLNHDGTIDIRELLYGIKHHLYSPMNADYQDAWKLMKQWSQYWEPNAAGVHNPPNQLAQGWVQGKIALYYAGQYALGYIPGAHLSFKWGIFHFPWVTSASSRYASPTPPGYGIWGAWNADSWGIPAATAKRGHLAMALDFINWVTAPKNEIPVALENGFTPTARRYTPSNPIQKTFATILQHPIMQGPAEATLGEQFLRDRIAAMQGYVTGVYSLPQTMQLMQQALTKAAAQATKITGLTIP